MMTLIQITVVYFYLGNLYEPLYKYMCYIYHLDYAVLNLQSVRKMECLITDHISFKCSKYLMGIATKGTITAKYF